MLLVCGEGNIGGFVCVCHVYEASAFYRRATMSWCACVWLRCQTRLSLGAPLNIASAAPFENSLKCFNLSAICVSDGEREAARQDENSDTGESIAGKPLDTE